MGCVVTSGHLVLLKAPVPGPFLGHTAEHRRPPVLRLSRSHPVGGLESPLSWDRACASVGLAAHFNVTVEMTFAGVAPAHLGPAHAVAGLLTSEASTFDVAAEKPRLSVSDVSPSDPWRLTG